MFCFATVFPELKTELNNNFQHRLELKTELKPLPFNSFNFFIFLY